tara:strand:- start:973 stop:1131 length:159 start_codon:yes stop_codon:yes gene_type:complete
MTNSRSGSPLQPHVLSQWFLDAAAELTTDDAAPVELTTALADEEDCPTLAES